LLGRWAAGLPRDPLAVGVLLFLASAAVSTVTSVSPRTSVLGTYENFAGLTTVAACAVLFFATRAPCRGPGDARPLLAARVLAAAVAAAHALVQAARLDPIWWDNLSGFGGFIRPSATLGHPNFLAAFLVMALPPALYFAGRAAAAGRRPEWAVLSGG